MGKWLVEHRNHDYSLIGSAIPPRDLSFTLRTGKEGPHDVSYNLPLLKDNEELSIPDIFEFVSPYKTDYYLTRYNRDNEATFSTSGMHVDTRVADGQEYTEIAGKGWLHYLERRQYPFDPLNPNLHRYIAGGYGMLTNPERGLAAKRTYLKGSAIVEFLLTEVILNEPYGLENFSLVINETPETSGTWELALNDTTDLLAHITDLAEERDAGFEFWIDDSNPPAKVFHIDFAYPFLGTLELTTDPENNQGLLTTTFSNGGPGVNRFVGTGSGNDVKIGLLLEDNAAAAIYRRQDGSEDFGDVETRLRVNRLTADAFARQKNPYQGISVDVFPEGFEGAGWPGDYFWSLVYPGSLVYVFADLHHTEINTLYQVQTMDAQVSNEGDEKVTLNLELPHYMAFGDVGTSTGGSSYNSTGVETGSGLRFF